MACNFPISNHYCRSKYIEGRTGDPVLTRVMLHAVDLTLDQLNGQMQVWSSAVSGFDPLLLPGTYPPHVSYHFGADGCRVSRYVDITNTALSLGSGVSQDGFTDINTVHVALVTGQAVTGWNVQGIIDNIFIPPDVLCVARFLCCLFKELGVTDVDETNLQLHGTELPDLDIDHLIELINSCLDEPIPVAADICDQLAALPENGDAELGVTWLVGADCNVYQIPSSGSETALVANDSTSIDFTQSGVNGHTFTASVILNPSVVGDNLLKISPSGLYVAPADVVALATLELIDAAGNHIGFIFP